MQPLRAGIFEADHPELRAHILQGVPVPANAPPLQEPAPAGLTPQAARIAKPAQTQAEGERVLPVPQHHLAGRAPDEGEHCHPEHRGPAPPRGQVAPQVGRPHQGDPLPQRPGAHRKALQQDSRHLKGLASPAAHALQLHRDHLRDALRRRH